MIFQIFLFHLACVLSTYTSFFIWPEACTFLSYDLTEQDIRPNASLLYFWYAEVELANSPSESSDSSSRAKHILSCLGSGTRYSPFTGQPSSMQQLRARQGFKDLIKTLSSKWSRGMIDDHSAALICSAALFEELSTGLASALEILEHSFTMVLPGELAFFS